MAKKASPKSASAPKTNPGPKPEDNAAGNAGKEAIKNSGVDTASDPSQATNSAQAQTTVVAGKDNLAATDTKPARTQSDSLNNSKGAASPAAVIPTAPVAPAGTEGKPAPSATQSAGVKQSVVASGASVRQTGTREGFDLADRDQPEVTKVEVVKKPASRADSPPARPASPPVRHSEPASAAKLEPQPERTSAPKPESAPKSAPNPVQESEPEKAQKSAPTPEQITPYYPPRPSLFIVQIAPEMAPVAKVGGLADVVFGLTRELAIRGNHVEIILPKYDNLRYDHIFEMHQVFNDLWVPWHGGAIHCTVYFGFVHARKCFFIEPHSNDNFFNRGSIYGFNDDILRYAFFSRAAIEFLWQAGKHPDIIHVHDWQTALVPIYLYEFYQQIGMTHPRVCLTIHNFKHQGVTGGELLRATGLHQPERYFDRLRLGDNHYPNAINLLKGGIVYSNFVTTVSPRYAFETKDQGQGFGLESTLHTHHMKYGGVVNGIDYDVWNPEIDHLIPVQYGIDNLDGKYDNKRALRHRLMLADNEKPIVAFIGRLDPQKGLELVRHAIFYALERGAQFVLLGSSPDHRINNDFWGLKHMLNESPDCHLEIGFDEELAHLIYAGADMMLVPSQFEPCGLTQLISLRYGTIPVVRAVGGLADTVFDKDHSERPLHERNGYRFDNYDTLGLESALGRALACYYGFPEHFRELIKNAMRCDNSWNRPGQDYLNIYDFIRNR